MIYSGIILILRNLRVLNNYQIYIYMRIYNGTNSTMNLPMPNGSRLIIGSKAVSKQFFPTAELLSLLVSAYSRDDIAIMIDSGSEIQMGAVISALPGYIVKDVDEAIERLSGKIDKDAEPEKKPQKPTIVKAPRPAAPEISETKEESK